MYFRDRQEAGQKLTRVIADSGITASDWQVVGIARGGCVVGAEVAKELGILMQALCVGRFNSRKLRGTVITTALANGFLFTKTGRWGTAIPDITARKYPRKWRRFAEELAARTKEYNGAAFHVPERVLLIDDGVVSATTAIAAIRSLIYWGAREVILCVPVVPARLKRWSSLTILSVRVTEMVNNATGIFYSEFDDVPDDVVIEAVASTNHR